MFRMTTVGVTMFATFWQDFVRDRSDTTGTITGTNHDQRQCLALLSSAIIVLLLFVESVCKESISSQTRQYAMSWWNSRLQRDEIFPILGWLRHGIRTYVLLLPVTGYWEVKPAVNTELYTPLDFRRAVFQPSNAIVVILAWCH